jgi:uncharacterized repeat protein (TIGR01451 family)
MKNIYLIILTCVLINISHNTFSQIVVTKSADRASADPGVPITYTLQIKCPSTSGTCNNVVVTDPLNINLDYLFSSAPTGNVQSVTYNSTNHTVTITMNPVLNGTTDEVQLVAAIKNNTADGTIVPNVAYGGPGNTLPSNTVNVTTTNGKIYTWSDDIYNYKEVLQEASAGNGAVYSFMFSNQSQNYAIDNLVLTETLPTNFRMTRFHPISYYNSIGITYQIYYTTNFNSTYRLMSGGPYNLSTDYYLDNSNFPLIANEYITTIRFNYLNPIPGGGQFYEWSPYLNTGNIVGNVLAGAPLGSALTNCIASTGTINGVAKTANSCATINISTPTFAMTAEKEIENMVAGYLPGDTLTFNLFNGVLGVSGTDYVNPTVIDLLPPELEYISSYSEELWGTDPFGGTNLQPVLTKIDNYQGTGQTYLKFGYNYTITKPTEALDKTFKITIKAKIKTGIPTGTYKNKSFYGSTVNGAVFTNNWWSWLYPQNYAKVVDTNDMDGDGASNDTLANAHRFFNVVFPTGAGLETIKWVKGTLDTDYTRYPVVGKTSPGGTADYKLVIKNSGNAALKDIKVIDILPFVGDKGVIDLSNRNSLWRPSLIDEIISSNPSVQVFYSTASNPCRNELTPGIPVPCDVPNWSLTPPSDITTVQSLKFDFGSLIMQPGDTIQLNWPMRVPLNAPITGETAWNSFGYIATRNDNGSVLLASEPIKVGVQVLPVVPALIGNYVWLDENWNGIQDEAPSKGINNVRVDLYKAVGGSPNLALDSLVTYTLTSNSGGNPGYYQFSNIELGNYYTVVHKPINSTSFSAKDLGGNDNLDSDGTLLISGLDTLATSHIFAITGSEDVFLNIDQGLTPAICTPPTVSISGNQPLTCTTPSITLTASGGGTYSWTGGLGTNATASVSSPGTYTVTVSSAPGCSTTQSVIVTQNITPPTATITGTDSLTCLVPSVQRTASGGGTYLWSNGLGTAPLATISSPGIYTVTVTAANGCTATATTSVVYIPAVSVPVFTLGVTSTRCQGAGNVTYTATASNTTGITYTLDPISTLAGNTINPTTGMVSYVAGWTGTSTITASAAGCGGPKTETHTVTITPTVGTPVFTLGSISTICQGAGNVTYTATASNTTGITYSLDPASLTGGNTINATTGQVSYVPGWSGTSIITASAAGCNGPKTATHTVTITPSVTTPIFALGATSTRCQGIGNVTYSATASNSTGITYSLDPASVTGGNTINASTGEVTFAAGWSGTTTITTSAAGCNGPKTATHIVTVLPTVGIPVFTLGVTSIRCQGAGTVTYTATATNSTGITYTLDGASITGGNTINAATGQVTYVAGWSGTSIITATATGCNGPTVSTHTVTITPSVTTPVFALGATSIRCQGAGIVTYTATATNTTGITYSLDPASITGGNTINSSTGDVTFAAGWSGTTTITASAAGCNGPKTATHIVTVTPTVGTPVFALGATSVRCQAAGNVIYSATASNSTGITYSLDPASLTGGNTINAATGQVTYVAGWSGTSVITASAIGCNGPSTAIHTVTVNASVATPVFALGGTSTRCQGTGTVTYSATATNSTSISYSLNILSLLGGNTINSSTGAVTYTAGWTGISTITATANGCNGPTTASHVVTITPTVGTPVFALGATSTRCQGATNITYSATATNNTGITYTLDATSLSGGNTINATTGEITYDANWSGTSVITATASGCNGPKTATHTVTTTASVGTPVFTLGASSTRCQGTANIIYGATATNSTGISYSLDALSLSAGLTINASNGRVNYPTNYIGSAIITATATGCSSTAQSSHTATSTASVTAPVFALGTTSTRCQGAATVNYNSTSSNASSIVYSLNATSLSGGNTINAATGDVTYTAGWTGTSIITATANGCNGPISSTHTVTIIPSVGTPVFTLGLNSNRCQSAASIIYTASASNNTGITYSLDLTSILAGNTINAVTGEVTYLNTWFGTSQITATATGCNGPKSTTHTVTTAEPVQAPIFTLGASSIRCQGVATVNYGATALHATGITYTLDATSLGAGNTINSSTGNVTFTNGWSGTSTVTATAAGCFGPLTSTHTITTTPTVGNPVFALGSTSNRCIGAANVIYSASATNNTGITYTLDATSLSAGNTINATTGEVSFDPAWFGVSTITVTVTGCNGPKTATHTVTTSQAVLTPVFALGASTVRCQGAGSVLYSATAANATGIVYTLDPTSLLAGNTINAATGNVTFTAGWTGNSTVTATASGCYGPTVQTHSISTTPSVTSPVFDLGLTSTRCQGTGNVTYNATSSNQTSFTYTLDGISLAGGNTIDANTGIVTYAAGWSGTSRVTAIATGCSGPKSTIHTITITPTVGLPVFTLGASSVRCQSASTVIYSATSTNSTGMTYALDATSLSFGNSINPSTGAITFLSTWTGTSTISATATGCNGPRSSSHNISTIFIDAADDNAIGTQGTPLIIQVLNNDNGDTDPTKISIVTQPSNGFIQIGSNGEITFLPNGNFYGVDQFTYSVCSTGSSSCCSQATVNITVEESLNDPCSEATKSKIYYLPFPENTSLLRKSLWSAGSVSYLTDSVRTVLSIKIPYPGNIITYDHWEDGYEADITIPAQGSTEIWGDGILTNGFAPGYPTDIIPAGGYILIDNHFKYNPRNIAELVFDGRDKILSSNDIAISKISGDAGSATGSFNFDVQNVKTNVFDITRFGKFFVIPFGEDNTLGSTAAFKYTGLFARASQNGTIINLDYNADGLIDVSSPTLNEGEVWFYDGTASTPGAAWNINNANDIKSGAILTSTNNFGVDMVFGGIDSYGTRNMALLPGNFYGDVYFSPAHTTLGTAPVYAFFTNNLASPIILDWTAGTGATGSITIAGKSAGYLSLSLPAAYKFKSRGGEAYTAVAVFDADADGMAYDWSFNMIPESRLSTFASVAWAPGSSNFSGNYNPVWVTAPTATTLYIKYDGNLANKTATISPCGMPYDVAVPITALQSYKILDPDNDQTGLAVFTCDGTKIAAVWGQDPNGTPPGSPGMDVGYVMEPRCLQQLIIANDDISDTEPNTPVVIEIQNNDYGFLCTPNPTSVSRLGLLQPTNGTVVTNPDGTVTYTPNNGFQGTDTFEYRICSIEYPGICDIALVKVRVSTCIANSNENLFRGKVFVEALPDDGTYNGEVGADGVQVDLYIDANCNGVIDSGEGITQSTFSDISGKYSFSTKDGNNARDDFEPTASFSGNDGGLYWNNNWTEINDNGVVNTGDVQILNDPSSSGMGNAIRLSGPLNGINRALSFNNTLSAVLKFSYRREGLDRQAEGVNVLINGTTVFTLNDGIAVGTDLNYTNVYLPITAYNANGVNTLQFITNGSVSTDDFFWIDNIELSFYKNPPICYVAKVNTSTSNGNYLPSSLNTQTAIFNVLGVCDKDNNLGVLPQLIASDDNAFTSVDKSVIINVLNNDIVGKPDTSKVSFVGVSISPTHGTVSVNPDGTINYTPNPGYTGPDQFEYKVCSIEDPSLCDIALVNVNVSCASTPLIDEINGSVYIDNNNNGVFNVGENGLQNTQLNLILDVNKNGIIDLGETVIDSELTNPSGYYSFMINPQTTSLNYLDQFNFSTIANQSNGVTPWTTSWTKIGDIGTFGQNNVQISNITGLRIQSDPNVVSGAYRSMNLLNAISANLTLDYNEQNLDLQVNDYVDLQIANSASPSNWTLLKRFTGADGNQIGSMAFDISNFISSATTIRFVSSGSSLMIPGDLVYFDNIKVDYLQPLANSYIVQLAQPIPAGYSLTNPTPSPTGYYTASFTAAGQGTCGNNFGLAVTDLEVLKTVDIPNPYVGDTVQFTVIALNHGPTDASNVIVTDVLPTGYELISVNATSGTWVGSSWNIGNMVNGATETLLISAKVIAPGGYMNTASIVGDQPELNMLNNQSSATPIPIPIIDLSLVNQISDTSPNVNEIVTFNIDLTNVDLSPATNVQVKTVISNGFTNISNISNGGVLVGNVITWNLPSVLNGSTQGLTYTARILPPLVGTTYTTVAQVTAATEQDLDSTPNNNIATEDDQSSTNAMPLSADLSLTNQISVILPNVGQTETFTVTVTNSGPDVATNVAIANVVANGYGSISNISGGGTLVGNTIVWNMPNLPIGASQTFTYTAVVLTPGSGISYTNIAQVSASDQWDIDSSPNNNISTEDDQAQVSATLQGANLSLTKQINNLTPNVGETVSFTVTLHNSGPDLATNVAVEDIVPNGYGNISNISNSGILTGNTINWNIANIANGSDIVLTYQAKVNAPTAGINFTNVAQITASDQFDPNSIPNNDNPLEDDQAQVTSIPKRADLSLIKSANNLSPQVGEVVTFTITLNNAGPDIANYIEIKDAIPNGYGTISNISNSGTIAGNTITWNIANLANGASQSLTYLATVQQPTLGVSFTNIAQVTKVDEFDPNSTPNNNNKFENDQSEVTLVPQVANLSLVKQINDLNPLSGDIVTFSLTITNAGPNTATNISIGDVIPNGYSNISNISNGGILTGSNLNWIIPSLANGSNLVLTYQAKVEKPGAGISFKNIAQVTGVDQFDPNSTPNNNVPTEDDQSQVTAVPKEANLNLTKQVNDLTPNQGDIVTFTITVQNTGPDAATNILIQDVIPNGYSNISNVSNSGTVVGNTLEWSILNLTNGASQTMTYQALVNAPTVGTNFTNSVQVMAVDQYDPNSTPGNNVVGEDDQAQVTTVPNVANLSLIKTTSDTKPNVGDIITFTLTLHNSGPNTATNVSVEDITPNGYSNVSNASNGGIVTGNTVNWNGLTIANGANLVLTYTVKVKAPFIGVNYTNTAQVTGSDQYDPNSTPSNDNPTEDDQGSVTTVPQQANLSLTKIINNPSPIVGEIVTFTISLNNAGPDSAQNIVIEDAIPNGYGNIVNISNSGVLANDTINWDVPYLVSGSSILFTYQATVLQPLFGVSFKNIAQVKAVDQFDPNSTPNNDIPTEDDQDEVTAIVDETHPTVEAGNDFTKTCIINPLGLQIGEPTEANHTYSWTPSTGLSATNISNPVANPLVTTKYFVTKTNLSNGFTAIDSITVTVETTVPVANAGLDFTKNCVLNPSGATIGEPNEVTSSYLWTPSTGLSNPNISNPVANPNVSTTYFVTKTYLASGCAANDTVIVTVETALPVPAISGNDTLTCALTTVSRTASGGVSYAWSNGLGNNATASISTPGTYTVTVTGINGCTSTASTVVNQNIIVPTVSIAGTDTLTCVLTTVSRTASGGVSYAWSDGLGNNAIANISTPGTYTVTVTGINGCTSTASTVVNQNNTVPTVSITGTDTLTCALTIVSRTAAGGVSYAWSDGLGNNAIANISTPGTYTVTVTGINGCTSTASTVVNQNIIVPTVSIAGTDTLTCALTTVSRTVSGGVSYAWSNGLGNNATANISTPGTYTVTLTGVNGCTATATTIVSQDGSLPVIDISGNDTLTCSVLSVKRTASGGASYAWSNGLGNNVTADITTPGTYTVTVTGLNGCILTATTQVIQNIAIPSVTISGSDTLSVSKTSVLRIAGGGINYVWSNALGSNDSVSINIPGIYTVTATGINGCTATATTDVIEVRFGSIGGIAWEDNDQDGIQENLELHSSYSKVFLYNQIGMTLIDSTLSDANGEYSFDSLNTGVYFVRFKIPSGSQITPANMTSDSLDSDFNSIAWSGQINIDVTKSITDTLRTKLFTDIGFVNFGSIGGKVFEDKDFSNTRNIGDAIVSNVKIYLLNQSGTKIDSTISDALGQYVFDSIIEGNYRIQFTKPVGMNADSKDFGSDDTIDSDADALTGITDLITVNTGLPIANTARNNNTVDAGFNFYDSKIRLTKDGILIGTGNVGDIINYGFVVTNTGNTVLTNVHLIDSLISNNPIVVTPSTLAPNQTGYALATYYLNAADVQRRYVANSATVYGTDPLGGIVTDISDNINPYQPGPSDSTIVPLPFIDLSVNGLSDGGCARAIGDTVTFQMVVHRNDTLLVTSNISLKDSLSSNFKFISASVTDGTYDSNSGIWSNVNLTTNETDTLIIKALILTNMGGFSSNSTWVISSNYNDTDSFAGNKNILEDDYASVNVSVPIKICTIKNESVDLSTSTGFSTYQWQLNGVNIQGATSATFTATAPGNYTVITDGNTCQSGNCCPIIVEDSCPCPPVICVPFKVTKSK